MSSLSVNWSKTKHCVGHNGMITWNSLPDVLKVNITFSVLKKYMAFLCQSKIWIL